MMSNELLKLEKKVDLLSKAVARGDHQADAAVPTSVRASRIWKLPNTDLESLYAFQRDLDKDERKMASLVGSSIFSPMIVLLQ